MVTQMSTSNDTQKNPAEGQPSLLQTLLSNPAALSAILSLLKPKTETNTAAQPAGIFDALGGGGGFDKIGQVLSNPDLMKQLPSIISAISPFLSQPTNTRPQEDNTVVYEPKDTPVMSQVSDAPRAGGDNAILAGLFNPAQPRAVPPPPQHPVPYTGGADKRTALLMALKPYLGPSRGEAIDYVIKITELTDMFRKK